LGCALDGDLADEDAVTTLVELAESDAGLLRLARVRIKEATAQGPTCERAMSMLSVAISTVESSPVATRCRDADVGLADTMSRDRWRMVLMGPPGAGKGTQGLRLAERLDVVHISTGDLLRRVADEESLVGFQSRVFMDSGLLAPDALVIELLSARLAAGDVSERGFVLDGFPRTLSQTHALDETLRTSRVDVVVELVVPEATVIARLRRRNRDDDAMASLRRRLDDYQAQTHQILDWYRHHHVVWRIDGDQPPVVVTADIIDRLDRHRARPRDIAQ
jgi:adenylate kinase